MFNDFRWKAWLRDTDRRGREQAMRRAGMRLRSASQSFEQLEVRQLLAAGTIDPTFGSNGEVTTSFGRQVDEGDMVIVQTDGRIIVSGITGDGTNSSIFLARYSTGGQLDSTFGSGGKVTTQIGPGDFSSAGMALQPDGKIVVVGSVSSGSNLDFAVARYTSLGAVDTGFGSAGKTSFSFEGGEEQARRVALQSDGKIVVVGWAEHEDHEDFAVARLNPNGSLDSTFDGDGRLLTSFGDGDHNAQDVRIQSDGKIVVAGDAFIGDDSDFGVARYNIDGSLDSTFSSDGQVTTDVGDEENEVVEAVLIQPDGKIVAIGTQSIPLNRSDFRKFPVLMRYTASGALDSTFGSGGISTFDPGRDISIDVRGAALQTNGKIVLAGDVVTEDGQQLALLRYTSAGNLDTTFNGDGTLSAFFNGQDAVVRGVAIQADGKIVAAGGVFTGEDTESVAVTRYTGDLIVPRRPAGWMYRAYNPNADYHFYTTSYAEFSAAVKAGYRDETVYHPGFSVLLTHEAGSLPIHRLYNLDSGRHYYTASSQERDFLVNIIPPPANGPDTRTSGWRYEKDEGFIFTSQQAGTTEIFRLYNRNSGVHLYTQDATEKDNILRQFPGIWVQHTSLGFAFAGPVTSTPAAAAATRVAQTLSGAVSEAAAASASLFLAAATEDESESSALRGSNPLPIAASLPTHTIATSVPTRPEPAAKTRHVGPVPANHEVAATDSVFLELSESGMCGMDGL